jgi:hypothetical protein
MINPLPIINIARSSHKAIKNYRQERRKDSSTPEIKKLRRDAVKWTTSINTIGRENHKVGDIIYKVEENVINYLSAIEGVVMPCARYNLLIPNKAYFYTDPSKIKEMHLNEDSSLIERIYPRPEKAVSSIERIIENHLQKSRGYRHIKDFKKRKSQVVEDLQKISKSIVTPYTPGTDYSSVQKDLIQTVKKMEEIKSDYLVNIHELEYQRSLQWLKITAITGITLAVGILTNYKFKKPKLE